MTYARYSFKLEYYKKRLKLGPKDNLFTSRLIYQMITEIFFAMLIPYPWIQGAFYIIDSWLNNFLGSRQKSREP